MPFAYACNGGAPSGGTYGDSFDRIMLFNSTSSLLKRKYIDGQQGVFTQNAHLPDSGLLDSWADMGTTPQDCAARRELVRLLNSAVTLPSIQLNLNHCDPHACLDLPDHLLHAHAEACTRADPPTRQLILPAGLTEIPVWVTKFGALRQLIAHGFNGDADATLKLLDKQCPELRCDLSHAEGAAEHPDVAGMKTEPPVQTALANNLLRPLERPFVGTLDEEAKAGMQRFVHKVRETIGSRLDLAGGSGYNLGGFKVIRRCDGELELSKLETPPHVDSNLNPRSAEAEDLPKTIEVFNAHCEDARVAIWQAMTKCGYVDYLKAHAATLIEGEWDLLVNVGLYFSRNPSQNGAHKDTEGENLFVILFYPQRMMGIEYMLRLQNPPQHQEFIRGRLPSLFVNEVEEVLQQPTDGTAYATSVEPGGFIAGCDELMVHWTPFVHHRGAFSLNSVVECIGPALEACFGENTLEAYWDLQQQHADGQRPSGGDALAGAAYKVALQLEELALSDHWIDRSELEKLLRSAGLAAPDAKMFFKALSDIAQTEDPFNGTALIDVPHLRYSAEITMPRGKELRREMSEKLENGTVYPQPVSRDMARVWIMARRKET